jgi:hypothetical protein
MTTPVPMRCRCSSPACGCSEPAACEADVLVLPLFNPSLRSRRVGGGDERGVILRVEAGFLQAEDRAGADAELVAVVEAFLDPGELVSLARMPKSRPVANITACAPTMTARRVLATAAPVVELTPLVMRGARWRRTPLYSPTRSPPVNSGLSLSPPWIAAFW